MMAIQDLKALAKSGTDTDWERIDEEIPRICDDPKYLSWAYETGIKDGNEDVRDLAVSILEKTHLSSEKFKPMIPTLTKKMRSDSNPFVTYRSAFALAAHGAVSPEVIKVLKQAEKDPDTAEIASKYLSEVG